MAFIMPDILLLDKKESSIVRINTNAYGQGGIRTPDTVVRSHVL